MSRANWIEETTTSIAGTLGDGAVTLTAITGKPRFSSVFGTGARTINYVIEKVSTNSFEEGVGVVSGNVLTRTRPRATWNGTTYDETSPSPLQFGSAPTSGDVLIRIAPLANDFMPAPRGVQNTLGTDAGWIYSAHYQQNGSTGTQATLSTGQEYYAPYLCPIAGHVDGFAYTVAVVGTTGIKAGLYEVGPDGLPGPNITRFNAISNTSTGLRTDVTPGTWAGNAGPLRVGVDWFYIGWMTNDGSHAYGGWNRSGTHSIGFPPLGRFGGYGFGLVIQKTAENSYATGMPSGTPTGTYSTVSSGAPAIALRVVN